MDRDWHDLSPPRIREPGGAAGDGLRWRPAEALWIDGPEVDHLVVTEFGEGTPSADGEPYAQCGGFAPLTTMCSTGEHECGNRYCYLFFLRFAFPDCGNSIHNRLVPTWCYAGIVETRFTDAHAEFVLRCRVITSKISTEDYQCIQFGLSPRGPAAVQTCSSYQYQREHDPNQELTPGGLGEWRCTYS